MPSNTITNSVIDLPYPHPVNNLERDANFAYSSTKIVGAVWDNTPRRWWIPAGLEYAHDPSNPLPNYRPPFFGALYDYDDDDHGWIEVHTSSRRYRRAYRGRRVRRAPVDMAYKPSSVTFKKFI